MLILDLEYYLSSYINSVRSSNMQILPQYPDHIPLNEFGNWSPTSNSIFNLLINYPSYPYKDYVYTFSKIVTPAQAYIEFDNNFLRNRICTMLVHEDVYIANPNATDNILSLSNDDLQFINDVLQNPNINVFDYKTSNPIIYSFMFTVSSIQNTTNLEPIIPEGKQNSIADLIYFVAMNNQFITNLANNVTALS